MSEQYFSRTLETVFKELSASFPVVLITGARQTGKSTMLKHMAVESRRYISLDNPNVRALAQSDPETFLDLYPAPIIIDEVQYAPALFTHIKIRVDEKQENGAYWLTGSQMFRMMKGVSESLAGRLGILNLYSLSQREIAAQTGSSFLPGQWNASLGNFSVLDVFDKITRGGMPRLHAFPDLSSEQFFSAYLQTYIERDIRELIQIQNEVKFVRFVSLVAARSGQELIYEHIAAESDINIKTAQSWLSLLLSSGLVYLLQPYFNNTIKRIVKRPKIIFMDSGLAAYLALWTDSKTLELSAASGAFFETYVISEIIKSYAHRGIDPTRRLFYYRDDKQKEIDLLIIQNGMVHPIEIKKSSNPGLDAIKNFDVCEKMGLKRGTGAVVCNSKDLLPLGKTDWLVPVSLL